jgi:hypothetical protein
MKLKTLIADANEAHPQNTEKAVNMVKTEIARIAVDAPNSARALEHSLIEEGIKRMLDQARSVVKAGVKTTSSTTTSGIRKPLMAKPSAINPSSNVASSQILATTILDDWMIGKGINRKSLGDATGLDLDQAVNHSFSAIDGHNRNVTFYQEIRKQVADQDTVKKQWSADELENIKAKIWEEKDAA